MGRLNKTKRRIWKYDSAHVRRKTDYLTTEEPLEIQLRAGNERRTAAITMRTPGNDYELALGFLYHEGIIHDKHDVVQMTYCVGDERELQEYNALDVRLRLAQMPELPQLDRYFFKNSACGICGAVMIEDLQTRNLPLIAKGSQVSPEILIRLPAQLRAQQQLFDSTGGLHAAAVFDVEGNLLALREDVGRHNALDKLTGWALNNNLLPFSDKIIMVSGRASYELLQKCLVAGAPIFCAVSAPSSLAVELAEQFDITLVGFLRGNTFNIYAGVERLIQTK